MAAMAASCSAETASAEAMVRAVFAARVATPRSEPFVEHYSPYGANQLRDVLYRDCARHWDAFYRNNGRNAYKDRHYVLREFPQLHAALAGAPSDSDEEAVAVATADCDGAGAEMERDTQRRHERRRQRTSARAARALLCDFGCGVGNLCLPLLDERSSGELRVVASDLSTVAVRSLRETVMARGLSTLVSVTQCDLSQRRAGTDGGDAAIGAGGHCSVAQLYAAGARSVLGASLPEGPLAVHATLVFVLCSVPADLWDTVVSNVAEAMHAACDVARLASAKGVEAPPSYLFFRDYCRDDLAMARFRSHRAVTSTTTTTTATATAIDGDAAAAAPATFARTNGTLSHFFSPSEVAGLFAARFDVEELRVITVDAPAYDVRSVDGAVSERRFVQGLFRLRCRGAGCAGACGRCVRRRLGRNVVIDLEVRWKRGWNDDETQPKYLFQ
jgi:methyltransferase-like protein 6